jgi:DnaJ-class molecular chaperone
MAERPVCGTCDGHGQTRASSAGPWSVCGTCGGAGRVDGSPGTVTPEEETETCAPGAES